MHRCRHACSSLAVLVLTVWMPLVHLASRSVGAVVTRRSRRLRGRRRLRFDDRGQATTEYALVLLGAALVALLLVAWATGGGGAGKIGRLLDRVLDSIIGRVS